MRSARLLPVPVVLAAAVLVASCSDGRDPVAPSGSPSSIAASSLDRVETTSSFSMGAVTLNVTADDTVDCQDTTTVEVTLTGSTQPQNADLSVALDASGSIGASNWTLVQQFGEDLANSIPWSPTGNRMGVVEFATNVTVAWRFGYAQDGTTLAGMFASLPWLTGYTNTGTAVDSVIALYDSEGRADAARMLLLVTDGNPYYPAQAAAADPCRDATALQSRGIHTVIVGVGAAFDPTKVACLVTSPTDIYTVADFTGLSSVLDPILQDVPRISGAVYTATVPDGFALAATPTPTAGSVSVSGNQITWTVGSVGAETDSLPIHLVHVGTDNGPTPLLTGQNLDYTVGSTGHSEAVPDVNTEVVGCDTTPPVIAPDISGTLGDHGWYTSDVTVAWNVDDPESEVTSTEGCDTVVVNTDTPGQDFACGATSMGGTDTVSVTVERDATPPTVVYAGNLGTYGLLDTLDITCTAGDATSGLASDTCADISGTGLDFGPGLHADTAMAVDSAGNTTTATTSFTVTVSLDELEALVNEWVTQHGVANAMIAKLEAAKNANTDEAYDNTLQAFINQVEAQSGKTLTEDQADTLILLAQALMI